MPLLSDEREMNTALQLAAQKPFEGVDPGFIERFKSDFGAMHEAKNSNSRDLIVNDIQKDFIKDAYQKTGLQVPAWIVPKPGFLGPADFSPDDDLETSSRSIVDGWNKQHPDQPLTFPSREQIDQEAVKRGAATLTSSAGQDRRSTGWGSAVGGFAGSAAGAMTDPINAASMMFGAPAAGILRTAIVEGAINAGSEALVQGVNYDWRKQIDPNYSVSDAASEILAAGVGGAALGGGLKGLAAIWERAKTGSWPSHVRDTANVVTREAATPASRFEPSIAGETAHQGALFKAADDIAQGRPVELPPEAFMQANARPGRVYDADGKSVGVRYEIAEADDLVTSHMDDLALNPDFPQELQPRDRTRAMSQDQIAGIASNLQPERLGFSTDAANGAPIVGPDGLVESGNGRVLALRRAMQQDGPQANSYRNYLRSQNFDLEGFRNPVLIARRVTDLEDRVGFVTAANRSTAMRLGASEQALSDARLLDGDLLDRHVGGDIGSAENQQFTRGFMSKLPRAEQGNLIDKDGFLSQEGHRRITSALMGRAYGEPVLLGRALEDTDNNIKSIAGALADSSGSWAKMRDSVARGEVPAGMDITKDLMNAVQTVMRARDEGRAVKDLVNQAEMFGGPDELSKIVARAMFSDAELKRPVGRAKLATFLNDFATEAMKNDAGPRLFGDALDATDILKSSLDRVGRQDLQRIAEERLTPEAVEKLRNDPATAEASIMDAERLIADNEARQLGPIRDDPPYIKDPAPGDKRPVYYRGMSAGESDALNAGSYLQQEGQVYFYTSKDGKAVQRFVDQGYSGNDASSVIREFRVPEGKRIISERQFKSMQDAERKAAKEDRRVGGFDLRGFYEDLRQQGIVGFDSVAASGFKETRFFNPTDLEMTPSARKEVKPILVDLGDGLGDRDLNDIMREADEEIAAGKEIEACTIGKVSEE